MRSTKENSKIQVGRFLITYSLLQANRAFIDPEDCLPIFYQSRHLIRIEDLETGKFTDAQVLHDEQLLDEDDLADIIANMISVAYIANSSYETFLIEFASGLSEYAMKLKFESYLYYRSRLLVLFNDMDECWDELDMDELITRL